MSGAETVNALGTYANAALMPGARYLTTGGVNSSGSFWVFGGDGYGSSAGPTGSLNDLWKYNVSTSQWIWMAGSQEASDTGGVYGTEGVGSPANTPGQRYQAVSWNDAAGNFWMFGGNGGAGQTIGQLNDLWEFVP